MFEWNMEHTSVKRMKKRISVCATKKKNSMCSVLSHIAYQLWNSQRARRESIPKMIKLIRDKQNWVKKHVNVKRTFEGYDVDDEFAIFAIIGDSVVFFLDEWLKFACVVCYANWVYSEQATRSVGFLAKRNSARTNICASMFHANCIWMHVLFLCFALAWFNFPLWLFLFAPRSGCVCVFIRMILYRTACMHYNCTYRQAHTHPPI